jgi:hypothetical protein
MEAIRAKEEMSATQATNEIKDIEADAKRNAETLS